MKIIIIHVYPFITHHLKRSDILAIVKYGITTQSIK